jgi:hypothetical protein
MIPETTGRAISQRSGPGFQAAGGVLALSLPALKGQAIGVYHKRVDGLVVN